MNIIKVKYREEDYVALINERDLEYEDKENIKVLTKQSFTTKNDLDLLINYIIGELENANYHSQCNLPEQIANYILKHSDKNYKLTCAVLRDIAEHGCLMN